MGRSTSLYALISLLGIFSHIYSVLYYFFLLKVNIISLVLGVLALLADISWVTLAKKADAAATYDDDAVDAVQKSYNVGGPMIAAIVIECVRMVLNAMGIYGAVKYKVWAVGASLVGYIAQGIWALITFDVTTLVVSSLFAYPHVYLIMEMRNGIMSEDTYEQEKFSCCCV